MKDLYAVFGNPIAHSKSPMIHAEFAKQTGENIEYTKNLVESDQFATEANKFFGSGGKGLNITVPFKLDAFQFAEQHGTVNMRAKLAGAVNTLKKLPDGKIFGDNTDGIGLVRDITQNLKWTIKGKNILILGAGGAVRGVMGPLLEQQPKLITIRNRTRQKAEDIKSIFSKNSIPIHVCTPEDAYLVTPDTGYDLVINGTSTGLLGNDENWFSPVEIGATIKLSTDCYIYDMMYGKNKTDFLQFAEARGCEQISDGLGMLVEQAAESFYIWRGIRPATKAVIAKVRSEL